MKSFIFWVFIFITILISFCYLVQENQVINEVRFAMFNFFQSMPLFDNQKFDLNLINRLGI
jgi:hypothetical protein